MSNNQIYKDPMRSYKDVIIGPATNNVARGRALSPGTDDASKYGAFQNKFKTTQLEGFGSLRYLSIHNFNREIKTLLSAIILSGIRYSFTRFSKPEEASAILKSWRRMS